MKIKVTDIDYEINEEDLFVASVSMEEIRNSLPKELEVEVDEELLDSEELEDILADEIAEQTGWLVRTFNYEIIGE